VTSDILSYDGVDEMVDATTMPFPGASLRVIGMLNVFHHISRPRQFLAEAQRCLAPGRMLIVDEHPGIISTSILKFLHHEQFRPTAERWEFESAGPLSGANGALAWIVFQRDREQFEREFPKVEILRYAPHTPLRYWLAGWLKSWSVLGRRTFRLASALDRFATRLTPDSGSFVYVEICKR